MAHWANYNGHLFTPHIAGSYDEISWTVFIDGVEYKRCSTEDVAKADVAYYKAQGENAIYKKVVTSLNIIEDY